MASAAVTAKTVLIADDTQFVRDRFLTTRGDVYRVQSVGYFDDGGAVVRLEAVIDATQLPPRLVFFRDLTHLGRGYPRDYLIPPTTTTGF